MGAHSWRFSRGRSTQWALLPRTERTVGASPEDEARSGCFSSGSQARRLKHLELGSVSGWGVARGLPLKRGARTLEGLTGRDCPAWILSQTRWDGGEKELGKRRRRAGGSPASASPGSSWKCRTRRVQVGVFTSSPGPLYAPSGPRSSDPDCLVEERCYSGPGEKGMKPKAFLSKRTST